MSFPNITLDGPTTDGTLESAGFGVDREHHYFTLAFFDANGEQVTPSAGSCVIQGYDGACWHDIDGGTITASDVYLSSRTLPSASGPMVMFRCTMTGVVGATTYRIVCRRF